MRRTGLIFQLYAAVVIISVHSQQITSTGGATVLPFFIKLHKVASSTVASLFNCVAKESGEKAYRGMLGNFSKCRAQHSAWSHMNTNELERYGMRYFAHCGTGDATRPVKIVTILRHPADRFVSALRYFDQVRKRKSQVRLVMTKPEKVSLREFQNLTYDIFSPDPNVRPKVRLHEYVDVFASLDLPWSSHKLPWPKGLGDKQRDDNSKKRHHLQELQRAQQQQTRKQQQQEGQQGEGRRQLSEGGEEEETVLATARTMSTARRHALGRRKKKSETQLTASRRKEKEAVNKGRGEEANNGFLSIPPETVLSVASASSSSSAAATPSFTVAGAAAAATMAGFAAKTATTADHHHHDNIDQENDRLAEARPPRYSPLDFNLPSRSMVDSAKQMLEQHFIVGLTEDMGGFLALLSVELNWLPSDHLCLPYPCQLKHGNSAYNCSTASYHMSKLTPVLRSEIDRLVAPDLAVYQHAQRVFRKQSEAHGSAFTDRLAELESAKHAKVCEEKRANGLQSRCKMMRR